MSHMKNRCTPHLPPIVRSSFVIAVRTRPGPRPSEFRRHRGWEYAHIDGVHPTYAHGIMERTLHYILAHVVHSPLSLSPCRSCSPPPPLPPPHLFCAPLPRPSCMAALTPLHVLALRAFPSHTMRGPIFTLLNYIFLAMLWLKHYCPHHLHILIRTSPYVYYLSLFLGRLHPRVQSSGESVRVATHPLKSVYIYLPTTAPKPSNTIIYLS
ncbi:hypothetical protein B0H14DRAFT_2893480 [Mycena olivaceomarginata]|nr:hypothetical protein B0H14DRAFT_2893480 [Mycena olivaceomarginata]